jgi:hypothetical protein
MAPTVGIIQGLTQIPIGLLQSKLDGNGPYGFGSHTLTTWLDGAVTRNVSDTFGVVVQINGAIAPALGRRLGYDDGAVVNCDIFDLPIVQVVQQHQDLSGAWLVTELVEVQFAPFMMRWAEDLPGRIGLYVSPTWSVDLFYLSPI